MEMKRRLLAWIMTASMVLGMLPGAAFAAGPSPGPAPQASRAGTLVEDTDYTVSEANTITVKTAAGLAGALAGLDGKTYATVKLDGEMSLDSTLPITKAGLTLDLNGQTVTYTKSGAALENSAQTTIQNGTISAANGCGILNGAGGKLTLSGVNITAICPLENRGEATVKSGTLTSNTNAAAILSLGAGKLTIDNTADNAKIDIAGGTGIHAQMGTITVKGDENVTITGKGAGAGVYAVGQDTVVSWNGPRADGSAILLVAGSYQAATNTTLELRGGKYTSAGASAVAIQRTTKDAQTNSAYTVAQSVAVNIYSGTFNKDPKGIKAPTGDANTTVAFSNAISAQSGAAEWKAGAPVDCAFTLKPANASVEVKDGGGNVISAASGSTYQLVPGVTYSYTVSAEGYASKTGQVTSAQTAVNVELESTTVPVASVTLSETALALVPGGEATLTATVAPENATDKAVVWTSSDEAVATVRTDGLVTAVAAGSATITATAGGVSAECTVTVTEAEIVDAASEVDGSALENSGLDETDIQTVTSAANVESEDLSGSAAQTAEVQAAANEAAEIAEDETKKAEAVEKLKTAIGTEVDAKDVVIVVQPIIKIKPSAASKPKEGRIVLDITAMVRVVATTNKEDIKTSGDGQNAVAVKDPQTVNMTGRKVTLKIPIPVSFASENDYVYVTHKNRVTRQQVLSGVISYINTHGFSEFEITTTDTTKASVGDENFTSLAAAVAYALENGKDTIGVRAGGGATVTINQAGTYIFTGDGAADVVVTAGGGFTVTKDGTTWTVAQKQPSSGGNGDGGGGGGGGGGGSDASSSTGRPSVTGSAGGTVKASSNGTVTITPSAGYEIASVTVNGKTVEIPDDGVLTGLKGSDKVKVTFKRAGSASSAGFADVSDGAWYAKAVDYVYRNNIMAGVSSRSFAPGETLTRGMIVQMLYALEGKPAAKQASFTDVAAGAWYADAVGWASENGIVSGLGGGSFGPNNALTREQMALILYGYAKNAGYDVSASANLSGYADLGELSGWAADAMKWAVGAGLLSGRSKTALAPGGSATRAEVAVIMMNFCEKVAK